MVTTGFRVLPFSFFRFLVLLVLTHASSSLTHASADGPENYVDAVCGPRAVHFTLAYYGNSVTGKRFRLLTVDLYTVDGASRTQRAFSAREVDAEGSEATSRYIELRQRVTTPGLNRQVLRMVVRCDETDQTYEVEVPIAFIGLPRVVQ